MILRVHVYDIINPYYELLIMKKIKKFKKVFVEFQAELDEYGLM